MVSVVLIGVWLTLLAYNIYKWASYKPKNLPNGPFRFPILGSYPLLLLLNYKHIHKALEWLHKFYKTDIYGLYAAHFPTIVANSMETVRAVLENKDLDGKPLLELAKIRDPEFLARDGPFWAEQRRFTLRYLRDYGFDMLDMIDFIKNGPKYEFEKNYHDGESVLIPELFAVAYSSFFHKILLNKRLPREKKHLLLEASTHGSFFNQNACAWGKLFSYWNVIAKLFPELSSYKCLRESSMKYHGCMKAILDEQFQDFDKNHDRHFLDLYFKKIEESKNDPKSSFSYEQLTMLIADFFFPSFIANPTQTQFLFQRFYLQPEILKKCQNEIDQVVGRDRLPTLDDRVNLPYLEATIRESLRHETVLPNGVAHLAMADTKIMGYDIPKNTVAFTSLYAAHKDEKLFDQPDLFKPERFLDENGMFSPKLDKTLPFGAGKRICAGETFARNSLFLVISVLVQHFDIEIPKNSRMPLPSESGSGILRFLPKYRLKFLPRN